MALPFALILSILVELSSSAALPPQHPHHIYLTKRKTTAHEHGRNFGIAVAIAIFAAIVFCLGVRCGRAGTWYCWRNTEPTRSPTPYDNEKALAPHPRDLRSSIGFPKLERCTVPVDASPIERVGSNGRSPIELSPLEAAPKFWELPAQTSPKVFEIGVNTPKSRSFFEEIRRKSWFARERRSRNVNTREGGGRSSGATGAKRSVYEMDGESPAPPRYPESVWRRSGKEEGQAMDWDGIEYMRKMYAGRGSVYRPGS